MPEILIFKIYITTKGQKYIDSYLHTQKRLKDFS